MKFKDSTYDWLKWLVMLCLPAAASCITILGGIWDIPCAGQIADTIVAVNAMLAAMLGISSIQYHKDNNA